MTKLSSDQRNKLNDSDFGIPEERMYPLHDKAHVESAAKLFGHADAKYKKSLARKILRRAKDFNIDTSGWSEVLKYAQEQVPPMSDGTSLGNASPSTFAAYNEEDELVSRADQLAGNVDIEMTVELAREIAYKIHEQTKRDAKPPAGNQNCQLCTWCAEAQFRGMDVLPRPVYSPRDPVLGIPGETIVLHPIKLPIRNNDDAVTRVKEAGSGARYYVHVNWKGSEGGHEFLLINIAFQVYLMDAQAGIVENVDENQRYFDDTNFANSYMARLDDHHLNSYLLKDATDPSKTLPWDSAKDIPYMRENGLLGEDEEIPEDGAVQEAACNASLLNVKNQLMNKLSGEFEFIGGSLVPKFTMKSNEKPDVAFEVNVNGQSIEVTPVINGIPDLLHKRRGIAIMCAANTIAEFARETVKNYKPVQESFMDEYEKEDPRFVRVMVPSEEAIPYMKEDPELSQYWEELNKSTQGVILVDRKTKKQIGHVFVHTNKKDKGFIFNLEVKPEYRRQGFGWILTDDAVRRLGGEDLTVDADNEPAIKLYTKYGFTVYKKGQWHYDPPKDELWMKFDRSKLKPIQEGASNRDDTLIPVKDFQYDTVYRGAMGKFHSDPLFVTPFKGIACIFVARDAVKQELRKRGLRSYNLGYNEWKTATSNTDEEITTVHVKVRSAEGKTFEPFEIDGSGYLYAYDVSKLKDNIYRYGWMNPKLEFLVANCKTPPVVNTEQINVHYIVEPEQAPVQEGATMDFKDDELLSVLKNSEYGVAYHDELITNPSEQDYMNKWHCLSPNEFISAGGGVCYDFVEWEADYLEKHQIPFKKFHISHHIGFDKTDVGKDAATHSICVAIVNGKYMYIEGSSKKLAKAIGYIKEFNSIDELLDFAVKHTIHEPEQSKLIVIDYTNVDNLIGLNLFDYQNRIFSKGKVIKSDFIQEGAIQDIKNGVNPFSDDLVFHVSPDKHLDGQVWEPRVPDYLDPYNPDDTGFEDNTTPRICFSTSIEGALNGITVNIQRQSPDTFDKMYVYVPEKPWKKYKHKTNKELVNSKLVYDANVTREVWIMEPVRMKLYGVIRVDQVSDAKRKAVVPTASGQKDTRNYYTYKWHWVVKPKALEKATKFDYSTERVISDLCVDLKKFKYGLIKDGRLMTGNVSEEDYDKYWVFHTGQEVDEAGGGNCYDMVEYEAGYLEAFGISYKKYFMSSTRPGDETAETHTFVVVPNNGKFIYIEQAFKRVIDEWGDERQKSFDKLNDLFDYVAECSTDFYGSDLNFGVWDYTDEQFTPGTPMHDFQNWIYKNCKMVYDGEAKKSEVKTEMDTFITIGDSMFYVSEYHNALFDDPDAHEEAICEFGLLLDSPDDEYFEETEKPYDDYLKKHGYDPKTNTIEDPNNPGRRVNVGRIGSNKERNRLNKFLRENGYDPKTETIQTDINDKNNPGRKKRVKFGINSAIGNPGAPMSMPFAYGRVDNYMSPDDEADHDKGIAMSKRLMQQKPGESNYVLKHEEGHLAYDDAFGKETNGQWNANPSHHSPKQYRDDVNDARQHIRNQVKKNPALKDNAHDMLPTEYQADKYGEDHNPYGRGYGGAALKKMMAKAKTFDPDVFDAQREAFLRAYGKGEAGFKAFTDDMREQYDSMLSMMNSGVITKSTPGYASYKKSVTAIKREIDAGFPASRKLFFSITQPDQTKATAEARQRDRDMFDAGVNSRDAFMKKYETRAKAAQAETAAKQRQLSKEQLQQQIASGKLTKDQAAKAERKIQKIEAFEKQQAEYGPNAQPKPAKKKPATN